MRHCEQALFKKKGVPLLGFSSVVAAICAMHMLAHNANNTRPCCTHTGQIGLSVHQGLSNPVPLALKKGHGRLEAASTYV